MQDNGLKRRLRLPALVLAVVGALAEGVPAPAQELPSALEVVLGQVFSNIPHPQAKWSACAIDLASQRVVFERYADAPLVPASAMKVFTMAAALAELGPHFEFDTLLATDGVNLFVVGDGDPGFGDEKIHEDRGETITAPFSRWAMALNRLGLAEISGDLVIDESVFDDQRIEPSWESEDLGKWYAAPVGALNFNDNCMDITVSPAGQRDAPVLVEIRPEISLVRVVNRCRSGGKGAPILHHDPGTFEYQITGRCAKRWPFGSVAFPDPGLLFADSLRTTLGKHGVPIRGETRRQRIRSTDGTLPLELTVVDGHRTPVGDVLARAGKNSQNLFAECLLKRTSYAWAKRSGVEDPQGSWRLGGQAVVAMLARANVGMDGFKIADGSGLSRENACTARQLASVLAWAHAQPFGRRLRESLSTAGVDGSLRKRLTSTNGRVHAKTGTMRGIRTLAGYVDGLDGPRFAFAVMFNGYRGPSTPYKEIQDRFCRGLAAACKD